MLSRIYLATAPIWLLLTFDSSRLSAVVPSHLPTSGAWQASHPLAPFESEPGSHIQLAAAHERLRGRSALLPIASRQKASGLGRPLTLPLIGQGLLLFAC